MNKKQYILGIASVLLVVQACIEPVELPLDEPSRVVVISQQFEANEPLQVLIAQSQPLFNGDNTYANNAVVSLLENGESKGHLDYEADSDGLYSMDDNFLIKTNSTYTLNVEVPGLKSVRAESTVPEPVRIRTLQVARLVETVISDTETELNFKLWVTIDDPADETNFYHLNFAQSTFEFVTIGNDTIPIPFPFPISALVSSNNDEDDFSSHPEGGLMVSDQSFNGTLKRLTFDGNIKYDHSSKILGDLFVDLRTVPQDYYLFFNSLQRQSFNQGGNNLTAFDDPTAVHTNVENGYGIFSGFSSSSESVKVK